MSTTETKTAGPVTGRKLVRHIVKLDKEGTPTDHCLCGHLWDQVHVKQNGEICQECVDELRRIEGGAA